MLKLIYLARRKPGFTFDEFVRRWRMHGARGMEGAFWRHVLGYVQAEPIRPSPLAGCSEDHDAIACFMLRDDAFAQPPDADEAHRMAQDELETFSAPIPGVSLWVDEERVLDGELGGVTAYLFYRDAERAREAAERAAPAEPLTRVVLDRRRDDGPLGPGANTLPYAAVLELAATSVPALEKALGSGGEAWLAEADVSVVTREAVLWDRMRSED